MGVETMVSEDKRRCIEEMLRSGATWGQIEERCGVSRSTISRARREILGLEPEEKAGRSGSVLEDIDLTVKAIELFDKGVVRDPTDLVKHLKISLPQAEELFNAIVKAKSMTVAPVVEASRKLDELIAEALDAVNDIESYIKRVEDVKRELNNIVGAANQVFLNLKSVNIDELKRVVEELRKIDMKRIEALLEGLNSLPKLIKDYLFRFEIAGIMKAFSCMYRSSDGYCTNQDLVIIFSAIKNIHLANFIKAVGGRIKVDEYLWICAFCPFYMPKEAKTLLKPSKTLQKS